MLVCRKNHRAMAMVIALIAHHTIGANDGHADALPPFRFEHSPSITINGQLNPPARALDGGNVASGAPALKLSFCQNHNESLQ